MLIRSFEIHDDVAKARLAFVETARALNLDFDCSLTSMWKIDLHEGEKEAFLAFAKDQASLLG